MAFYHPPLIKASYNGNLSQVARLLEEGHDVNVPDADGSTALMWASRYGHLPVAQLLIDKGAIIDAQNKDGETALDLAKRKRHFDTAKVLTDASHVAQQKEAANQAIYEEALKHGYINYRSITTVLTGVAGSGKTSVKALLFNQPPPALRESTQLAKTPVRAVVCVTVDTTGGVWRAMGEDGQDQFLAQLMTTVSPSTEPANSTSDDGSPQPQSPVRLELDGPTRTSTGSEPTSTEASLLTVPSESSAQSGAFGKPTNKPSRLSTPRFTEVDKKFLDLIASCSLQNEPSDVDMLFVLDCGGQPQFQDIFSLFLATPRIMIFVTDLSHTLDERPLISYYEKGKPLGPLQPSPMSDLEVLQLSIQALQSQAHAHDEVQPSPSALDSGSAQPSPIAKATPSVALAAVSPDQASSTFQPSTPGPTLLVVGTHRDKERQFFESRAEKNERLVKLLRPVFHKRLVHFGENAKEVIFPVNAKTPGPDDHKVASEIRKAVQSAASSIKQAKIPMKWQVLERAMKHEANKLGRPFLTRKECLELAQRLRFSEAELDVALDYLTSVNVVFYFRKALPDIIFVLTQALLDKLSELVHRYYQLQGNPDKLRRFSGGWLKFREKGLISKQLLEEFPKHYVDNLFTPDHLVKLLLHRLVVANIGKDEYFMPFILSHLSLKDLEGHRVRPSSAAAPLTITFACGVVPMGLFPPVVTSLLSPHSSYALKLYPSSKDRCFPECVHRNCIKFRLPSTTGSLTLIDAFTHLEAHVDAPTDICSKLCPHLKRAIFSALDEACSALKFRNLRPQAGVLCEHAAAHGELTSRPFWHSLRFLWGKQPGRERHHSEVSMEFNTWTCSLTPGVTGRLKERHLRWFPSEVPDGEDLPTDPTSNSPQGADQNTVTAEGPQRQEATRREAEGGQYPDDRTQSDPAPAQPPTSGAAASTFGVARLSQTPELHQFTYLENSTDSDFVKIIDEVQADWTTLAAYFQLPPRTPANIRAMPNFGPRMACQEVFQMWLKGGTREYRQPKDWNTIIKAIRRVLGNQRLADKVYHILTT